MFQGFYNNASSILTQTRKLNVISNNMANVSTTGYKSDQMVAKTFKEELIYRSGNKDKNNPTAIGNMNRIVTADRNYTNFANAGFALTSSSLDFALGSSGFFSVQSGNQTVYTRNGSFSLDNEGYLCLQGVGRVLGKNGPIQLGTDKITADSSGNIYDETGRFRGQLAVVDFQDYNNTLTKTTGDVFLASGPGTPVNGNVTQKALESSNVDAVDEMTQMMSSERLLQGSAQVLKIYDQLTAKMMTQLGPK